LNDYISLMNKLKISSNVILVRDQVRIASL
jgi:hypothetical protein